MKWKICCGIFTMHIRANTLEEALVYAETYMAYTQYNMLVVNADNEEEYYISKWHGIPAKRGDKVLADYGGCGFYEKWQDSEGSYVKR